MDSLAPSCRACQESDHGGCGGPESGCGCAAREHGKMQPQTRAAVNVRWAKIEGEEVVHPPGIACRSGVRHPKAWACACEKYGPGDRVRVRGGGYLDVRSITEDRVLGFDLNGCMAAVPHGLVERKDRPMTKEEVATVATVRAADLTLDDETLAAVKRLRAAQAEKDAADAALEAARKRVIAAGEALHEAEDAAEEVLRLPERDR